MKKVVSNSNEIVSQATITITETEEYIHCTTFGVGDALRIAKVLDSIFEKVSKQRKTNATKCKQCMVIYSIKTNRETFR